MKKLFAVLLALCIMAGALCITAFAEDGADVIRVSGLKRDGELIAIASYPNHAEGWEAAIDLAKDSQYMTDGSYDRIVVDLLADWTAVEGEFCNSGDGFSYDAIRFYENTRITLNMNGHTINRGLKAWQYNGEVIFIDDGADVIINGGKSGDSITAPGEAAGNAPMGTITGGFSTNGAGGIHMQDAVVTLNNVCLVGNTVEDDDGAAIAVHDGGTLTMNGGCMSNNLLTSWGSESWANSRGTLYVDDSTAVLRQVEISGNTTSVYHQDGVAVALNGDSEVTLEDCIVENNGGGTYSDSIFFSFDKDSTLYINKSTIRNNKANDGVFYGFGKIRMDGCTFTNNHSDNGIFSDSGNDDMDCEVSNSVFKDNPTCVVWLFPRSSNADSIYKFTKCTFSNNGFEKDYSIECGSKVQFEMIDCDLGNDVIQNKQYIQFTDSDAENGVGSIFGRGSLTMIIAFVALVVSIASFTVNVTAKRKPAEAKTETDK